MPELSVIIVTYNTKEITLNCLKSIFSNGSLHSKEVWVVDNGSIDGSKEEIEKKFPKVRLLQSEKNLGFSGGNNLAIKQVYKDSKYVLLLNSDTKIESNTLDNLYDFSEENNLEISSCLLTNPDGSFQPNGGDIPSFLPVFFWLSGLDDLLNKLFSVPSFHQNSKKYYQKGCVGWVGGTAMLINSKLFDKVGFLDEKIFMYGEDVDFCWRAAKKGIKIGWTDNARVTHIGGASTNAPKLAQWRGEFSGLLYLYKKYYGIMAFVVLKLLILFFGIIRSLVFMLLGKFDYAKTYAKIAFSI